jgi:hypothetical protein
VFKGSLPNVHGLLQTIKDECILWCMAGASKLGVFSHLVANSSNLGSRFDRLSLYFGWVCFPQPLILWFFLPQ